MVRYVYVRRRVLELYQRMDFISYPIHPENIISYIPMNCRIKSYEEMATIVGCTIKDVIMLCQSTSGATHYERENDRYLILYNETVNDGRTRWTIAHEIGHILIGHFHSANSTQIAHADCPVPYDQYEAEADYFAWNLLCPLPIMREMGIGSADEIKAVYGLSTQAAGLQYDRYIKWCKSHIKTAWDSEMIRAFRHKYVSG